MTIFYGCTNPERGTYIAFAYDGTQLTRAYSSSRLGAVGELMLLLTRGDSVPSITNLIDFDCKEITRQ